MTEEQRPKRKRSSSHSKKSKRRRRRFESKVLKILDSIEIRLDSIENRMTSLENRMTSLENRMTSLVTTVDAIVSTQPSVLLRLLAPYVLPSARNDIIYGAISTFTFVQICDHPGRFLNSFWAIGAAHCGVFYGGYEHYTFIHLPKSLCEMGVTYVMYPNGLGVSSTCYRNSNDFIAAGVSHDPTTATQKPLIWNPSIDTKQDLGGYVGGLSTSGTVIGSMLTYESDYFVFVEDTGEPGHSGTAMVSSSKHLLGVYAAAKCKEGNLRTCSIITPLPSLDNVTVVQCTGYPNHSMEMKMLTPRGIQTFYIRTHWVKGNVYASYTENGETYCGVLIAKEIPFVGNSMVGQAGRPC